LILLVDPNPVLHDFVPSRGLHGVGFNPQPPSVDDLFGVQGQIGAPWGARELSSVETGRAGVRSRRRVGPGGREKIVQEDHCEEAHSELQARHFSVVLKEDEEIRLFTFGF